MFSVTWIDKAGNLHAIAHPKIEVLTRVYRALLVTGQRVRLWDESKQLIF